MSLRSYLEMLNFKANHRKVFVADSADGPVTIVSSANPHDASSAHSNVALLIILSALLVGWEAPDEVFRLVKQLPSA